MSRSAKEIAREYIGAVGDKRFDDLERLLHPDAAFGGTVKQQSTGREAFVQGFRHLAPVYTRVDVRDIVGDDNRAFVLYDFVTDTPAGSVLCGELLTVENEVVRSSTLIFDWRRWPEVITDLQRREHAAATARPVTA
ncbi:MAG: nuclear transport factor 2 family protein [Candidatus Dormibacteraeota bacterium]|nr:nuclear transport factor 2 family protein [Candidatus Dormibacteraeota bacterium]MBV9526424.1 nuclear transport factor 2 family protein [Candidatus Dormibacteraeota bacterium]